MRTLHLNLSSRPYRNDRPFYVAIAALVLIVGFLMIKNIETAVDYFSSTRNTRGEIAALDRDIASEEKKAADIDNQIKRLDLRSLNARVLYVNNQIASRAFEWSELLDVLERLTPSDVRIRTLSPQILPDGTVHLVLNCEAKSPQGLINFLNRLLSDRHFSRPFPGSQSEMEGGLHSFSIDAQYRPEHGRIVEVTQ